MIGTVRDLWSAHSGQPAVVLGGGPSLPADYEIKPDGAVRIAVNNHALALDPGCEYCVYLDPWVNDRLMGYDALRVTYHRGSFVDYHFELSSDVWNPGFSSATATWLAAFMDCDPIILMGMDCFADKNQTYWHTEGNVQSSGNNWPLKNHQNSWRRAYVECPRYERIRVASGPLIEVFPPYDPDVVAA